MSPTSSKSIASFSALLVAVSIGIHRSQAADEMAPGAGGLAVFIEPIDFARVEELGESGRWLTLALVQGDVARENMRRQVGEAGLAGLVTVAPWSAGDNLPLSDHMANLIVDAAGKVDVEELRRVLVPVRGRAIFKSGESWQTLTRPLPENMDGWSHFFHDATGNKTSRDTSIRVPNALRFIGGPRLQDNNGANGWRVDGGVAASEWNYPLDTGDRYIQGMIVEARDAFNGILLWQEHETPIRGAEKAAKTKPFILADGRLLRMSDSETDCRVAEYDPLTGAKRRVYQSSLNIREDQYSAWYPQFNYHDGRIVQTNKRRIRCFDAETDTVLWDYTHDKSDYLCRPIFTPDLGLVIAIEARHDERNHLFRGRYPSAICEALMAFDVKTGGVRWRAPIDPRMADLSLVHPDGNWQDTRKFEKSARRIHAISYYDGRVFCLNANDANGGKPAAVWGVDAATGKSAWVNICGPVGADASMFDMFLLPDGSLFTYGHDWARMDQATGKLLAFGGTGGNARCDTAAGTVDLIVAGFGNYFDISQPDVVRWTKIDLARGQCGGWGTPAYGMVYYHGSGCGCYFPIRGNMALHRTDEPKPIPNDERRTKGPAVGPFAKTGETEADAKDWPEYLQNGQRRLWTPSPGPTQLKEQWSVKLAKPLTPDTTGVKKDWLNTGMYNGPLTAAVVADGVLVVADRDGRRVIGLSAATGKQLWEYATGGRVFTPPTLRAGRVVFGTRAGYVHCLDAQTGKLAWRFFAAPAHRYLVSYGQVESAWPVHGSLPVVKGVVVAAAGYHGEADGGIWVWGLHLEDGAIRWSRTLRRPERGWSMHQQDGRSGFRDTAHPLGHPNKSNGQYNPTFARNIDLPSSDGERVQIAGVTLDPGTGEIGGSVRKCVEYHGERFPFLDMAFEDRGGPHGSGAWGVNMGDYSIGGRDGPWRLAHDGKRLFMAKIAREHHPKGPALYVLTSGEKADEYGRMKLSDLTPVAFAHKSVGESADSFAIASRVAYVACEGYRMRPWGNSERPRPRWLKGEPMRGLIEAFNLENGEKLSAAQLDSCVINNGLAVAGERLYAVCEDGTVRCFGKGT